MAESKTNPLHYQTYDVRPGTEDLGKLYELNLIILFSLRLIDFDLEDMWIVNNANKCGNLDDIIAYIKKGDQEIMYLIQCKHTEEYKKITLGDLCGTKRISRKQPFSIKKYFESYKSIMTSTEDKEVNRTLHRLEQNLTCIVYTNYDVDTNCHEVLQPSNETSPCFKTAETGMIYSLKTEADIILRHGINPIFAKKLFYYTNRAHCNDIRSYIAETIKKRFEISAILDYIDKIIDDFMLFIMKWKENKLGSRFFLTRQLIIDKITEIILERCFTLIRFPNSSNKNNVYANNETINKTCDKWKKVIRDTTIITIRTRSDEEYLKILNFLFYYYYWETKSYFMEVIRNRRTVQWEKILPEDEKNKIISRLDSIDNNLKKEIIRIIGCGGNISLGDLYKLFWKVKKVPLLLKVKNDIKEYQEILSLIRQSKYSINVVVILNKMEVTKDTNTINQFFCLQDLNVNALNVIVGENIRLQGKLLNLEALIEIHEDLRSKITVADVINILLSDGKLNIGGHLDTPPKYFIERTFNEEQLNVCELINRFGETINIISAGSGMGKTTILNRIPFEAFLNEWVLKVNLKELHNHSEHLINLKKAKTFVEYLYNNFPLKKDNPHLDRQIFQFYLKSKSVIILFDGFESISSSLSFKDELISICKCLSSGGFKIWITTRPSWKTYLEEKLKVKSLTLDPISKDQLSELLTKYFKYSLTDEVTRTFCQRLLSVINERMENTNEDFVTVPQHLEFLAEYFEKEYKTYKSRKIEISELWEEFNLLDLLNKLVEKKRSIFLEKAESMYVNLYSLVEENIIQPYALKILEINKNLQEFQTKTLEDDGIIEVTQHGRLQFVHKLYAEYYAAKWLSRNQQETDSIKKLFQQRYHITRNLFDGILARNLPLHTAILNSQFLKAERLIESGNSSLLEVCDGGRTALHVAAAWGTQHPLPHNLENFSIPHNLYFEKRHDHLRIIDMLVEKFNNETLSKDNILKFTPLDFALASNCLENSNSILRKFKNNLNKSFIADVIPLYMYYCSRFNYNFLFEEILTHFQTKSQELNNIIEIITPTTSTAHEKFIFQYISERDCILYLYLRKNASYLYGILQAKNQIRWDHRSETTIVYGCDMIGNYNTDVTDKKTILHYAAENNCEKAVIFFLEQGIGGVNVQDNKGKSL